MGGPCRGWVALFCKGSVAQLLLGLLSAGSATFIIRDGGGAVAENDTCEKCSRILMVEQIDCGAPVQMTMNVIVCAMSAAHGIICIFPHFLTFHIFGFALFGSMLHHRRESEKTMSHAPLLSG